VPIWKSYVGKLGRKKNILALFRVGSKPFAEEVLRVAVGIRLGDYQRIVAGETVKRSYQNPNSTPQARKLDLEMPIVLHQVTGDHKRQP
jgi:hypothetical protein